MLNTSTDKNYGSNCELILASTQGDGQVSMEAYEAFYNLMVTYRHPMRYLEENQKIIQELSPQEKKLLEEDELEFINQKFQKDYPALAKNTTIETIPKTLYQLHAYADNVSGSIEHTIKQDERRSKGEKTERIKTPAFAWELQGSDSSFEAYCHKKMSSKESCQHHFRSNNELIKRKNEVKKSLKNKNPTDSTDKEIIHQFIHNIQKQLIDLSEDEKTKDIFANLHSDMSIFQYLTSQDNQKGFINYIGDMVLQEWESRKVPNTTFLYQGMKEQIHQRGVWEGGNSFSFGDGLFGGGIRDARTAMAFSYVAGQKGATNFTITSVEKHLTEPSDGVIYIPRVTPLMNLFGQGEFHHPRSKVAQNYDFNKHSGIQQGDGHSKDKYSFLVSSIQENNNMYKAVYDFQKNNSVELISKKHFTEKDAFSLHDEKKMAQHKRKIFDPSHQLIRDKNYKLKNQDYLTKNATTENDTVKTSKLRDELRKPK